MVEVEARGKLFPSASTAFSLMSSLERFSLGAGGGVLLLAASRKQSHQGA